MQIVYANCPLGSTSANWHPSSQADLKQSTLHQTLGLESRLCCHVLIHLKSVIPCGLKNSSLNWKVKYAENGCFTAKGKNLHCVSSLPGSLPSPLLQDQHRLHPVSLSRHLPAACRGLNSSILSNHFQQVPIKTAMVSSMNVYDCMF